jgi:hypothetical protein
MGVPSDLIVCCVEEKGKLPEDNKRTVRFFTRKGSSKETEKRKRGRYSYSTLEYPDRVYLVLYTIINCCGPV